MNDGSLVSNQGATVNGSNGLISNLVPSEEIRITGSDGGGTGSINTPVGSTGSTQSSSISDGLVILSNNSNIEGS